MMHQIESSRHSSLLQYSETIVDESFDYDKKKDQAFLGTVGRIVLNTDKTALAAAPFTDGITEVFLDITKYGMLYDLVMVCDLTITAPAGDGANYHTNYITFDSVNSVYDLFDTFEIRTRSGHVLYERKPWTYMKEFSKCAFRRYKELALRNVTRSAHSRSIYGLGDDLTTIRLQVEGAPGTQLKHRIYVPIYMDWFKSLSKSPDVMSLEDLVLVVRTKSETEIGKLWMPIQPADLYQPPPKVSFSKVWLRQYYLQPPQSRYNAIVQSLHPGGQPHNNMTSCQFFERLIKVPLTIPNHGKNLAELEVNLADPNAPTVAEQAAVVAAINTKGVYIDNSTNQSACQHTVQIKCQFPVYRTFVRAYWQSSDTTSNGRRRYAVIRNLKCEEAGQTFYEVSSGLDKDTSGSALYTTDILQEYDMGTVMDSMDQIVSDSGHERPVVINWGMANLLPEQGHSKTALSFFQMANPTISFDLAFPAGELPAAGPSAYNKTLTPAQAIPLLLSATSPGDVYVEVVHEYMCVFQTQASANMRNRSIRRMATK